MVEPTGLLALTLDAAFGWPQALYSRIGHPVGGFARVIWWCEARWNHARHSMAARRMAGVATVAILLLLTIGGGLLLTFFLDTLAGGWAWIGIAALAAPGLAQRSLYEHVRDVAHALEHQSLPAARAAVGRIVGRETQGLDEAGVSRAAIESLAESFSDGIAAPLFWLLIGGLPGIWAYKAINTADSLIGHREARWRAFGWAAARLDDVMNLVPARLAGFLICLAGGGGWRTLWRDSRKHASPNAGWPEAAMAGALDLRLAGPVIYDGTVHAKPWLGDNDRIASAADIRRALRIFVGACLFLWVIAGAFAWVR